MHQFPFGRPLLKVQQVPHANARVFVLGVYSSAVHARWLGPDGKQRVMALAVASEPYIFWRGDGARDIIEAIPVPPEAGRLVEAAEQLNGPSGKALDDDYLRPLGLSRADAWLCDLLPESRMNPKQFDAVSTHYVPVARMLGLPEATVPAATGRFADRERGEAILEELLASGADTLITLGDKPLEEFVAVHSLGHPKLRAYGESPSQYGRLHPLTIRGRRLQLLPLVHPRQAQALGASSAPWGELHREWVQRTAPNLAGALSPGNLYSAGNTE